MDFLARRITLWISGVATFLLTLIMIAVFEPLGERGGLEIVSLQFSFTPDRFSQIVERWGMEGVALFRGRMWLDFLYPTAYSFLLAGFLFRKTGSRSLVFVPFASALFDFAENTLHLKLLAPLNFSSPLDPFSPSLVLAASLFATAKWLCILFSLAVIIVPRRR